MATATNIPPHGLELVIDFVNTLDPDGPSDALQTPDGLAAWLIEQGLLAREHTPLTAADRELAVSLREALRSLMLANNGEPVDPGAAGQLDATARRGELRLSFAEGISVGLTPGVAGLPAALARLVVPVAEALRDGSWARVKACRASDCHWAFYDHSRNRSGVWCDMAVCGNRTKVRAHRARTTRPLRRPAP
jgi:predicted RNA-binding Zn ribbon-like protein